MNFRLVASVAFACVALFDASLFAQRGGPRRGDMDASRFGWLSSLDAGKARARASGKPIMVVIRCVP